MKYTIFIIIRVSLKNARSSSPLTGRRKGTARGDAGVFNAITIKFVIYPVNGESCASAAEVIILFDYFTKIVKMNNNSHPDRKTQILDAAEKRFARFGLSKATMEEIAGDLGMSKAALYYYFQTKEEVFREVIAREQAQFIAGAEKILAQGITAKARLLEYARQRMLFFREIVNLNLLGIQAWLDVKPFMGGLFKEFAEQETRYLTRILKEGKRSGEFALASPEKSAAVVLTLLRGWGHQSFKSMTHGEPADFRRIQEDGEIFLSILLNGLLSR